MKVNLSTIIPIVFLGIMIPPLTLFSEWYIALEIIYILGCLMEIIKGDNLVK